MKKYFYLAAIFLFSLLAFSGKTSAAEYGVTLSGNNFSGYAWSSNIGWISFSGPGYGVAKDGVGLLSGYAWSSNVGWLSFNSSGSDLTACPSAPCEARIDASNNLTGWARFIALDKNGADGNLGGWVRLSNLPTYGVKIGDTTNAYAWSNDFGWIRFASGGPKLVVCDGSSNSINMKVGETKNLQARYWNDFFGSVDCSSVGFSDVTAASAWSSSSNGIASVAGGTVSANGGGTATITAQYNGLPATASVNVYYICDYKRCDENTEYFCASKSTAPSIVDCTAQANSLTNCSNVGTDTCAPANSNWREVAP